MKNPKLIDEAWIDEQIEYVGIPNNKYDDALVHLFKLIKSKLQPLETEPMKTNVEKIRAGEMAIEQDIGSMTMKRLFMKVKNIPYDVEVIGNNCKYWYLVSNTAKGNIWTFVQNTSKETIKASELIKEIEKTPEPTEWQPKFGEVVEVENEVNDWEERIFLFKHKQLFYCVSSTYRQKFNEGGSSLAVFGWKNIRPVQKPTLTRAEADKIKSRIDELKSELAEAEAKLNVKIVD